VTEADGKREASILVAEGEKKSNILRAEGDKQASVLRAEGYAGALNQIFSAAKGIDSKTMVLQYLDTLKALGASPSTKYIFPLELTQIFASSISKQLKETEDK
jgi:regulator of protease activity HflC (stomatin/prohibitin superfamily)